MWENMMAGHARPSYFSTSPVFCIPWKRGKMGKTNKHTKLQTGNRSHFHGIWCFESILVFSIFGCRKEPAKKHMLYKFIYIYIYRRYFWPYYYTANVAPHRCKVCAAQVHDSLSKYTRAFSFFDPPSCLLDFQPTWMFENLDKIFL